MFARTDVALVGQVGLQTRFLLGQAAELVLQADVHLFHGFGFANQDLGHFLLLVAALGGGHLVSLSPAPPSLLVLRGQLLSFYNRRVGHEEGLGAGRGGSSLLQLARDGEFEAFLDEGGASGLHRTDGGGQLGGGDGRVRLEGRASVGRGRRVGNGRQQVAGRTLAVAGKQGLVDADMRLRQLWAAVLRVK